MITVKDLTFWYSTQSRIFEQLNLELEAGHIYGLLGKNGAGKTTLLKLICGLAFPKSGTVTVDKRVPEKREKGFLADIFLVPEEISFPDLNLKKFAETYQGFYPAFDPGHFGELLDKFEVNASRHCCVLSHGQKKKAMIAFALAANTRYLFLDEPTNGLDIPSKAALRSMLASSFTEDKTIILSTHMVRDLESMIDSIIILENRRILINRSLEQIARKLSFGVSTSGSSREELVFSMQGELGPTAISLNNSGREGKVDIEALFNACISIPDKMSNCFEH